MPKSAFRFIHSPKRLYQPSLTLYTPNKHRTSFHQRHSFNIHCDTDRLYACVVDFIIFLAFTFDHCIVACASYDHRVPTLHRNSTYYGVSFDVNVGENEGLNCLLQGEQDLLPMSRLWIISSA